MPTWLGLELRDAHTSAEEHGSPRPLFWCCAMRQLPHWTVRIASLALCRTSWTGKAWRK